MKKTYVIIYHFNEGPQSGFGNCCATISGRLNFKDIRRIEEMIEKDNGYDKAVIINLVRLGGK